MHFELRGLIFTQLHRVVLAVTSLFALGLATPGVFTLGCRYRAYDRYVSTCYRALDIAFSLLQTAVVHIPTMHTDHQQCSDA